MSDNTGTDLVYSLPLISTLLNAAPSEVCDALMQYAGTTSGVMLWDGHAGRMATGQWQAFRQAPHTVRYRLDKGPLSGLRLQFDAQRGANGGANLTVACAYGRRRAHLDGMLERWQARRDALALRDGVLLGLKTGLNSIDSEAPVVQRAERFSVMALAKLRVADREWRGEVRDVSETGLGMKVFAEAGDAEDDATILRSYRAGDVEILLPQERRKARVVVTRAEPSASGVALGLWMPYPEEALQVLQGVLKRGHVAY